MLRFSLNRNVRIRASIFFGLLLPWLAACPAFASEKVVVASHRYVLGDTDTRQFARGVCFREARRKAIESLGRLLEGAGIVREYQLSSAQLNAYTAALAQVETVKEVASVENGAFTLVLSVRAAVDENGLATRIGSLHADPELSARLVDEYRQMRRLAEEALPLRKPRGADDGRQAGTAGQRTHVTAEELEQERDEVLAQGKSETRLAAELVEPGMTGREVKGLLDPPRSFRAAKNGYSCERYGDVWVVYRSGVVECLRTRLSYSRKAGDDCHCVGGHTTVVKR